MDTCPRGTVWEPETTYTAECFLVPVAFEPMDEGWRSLSEVDDGTVTIIGGTADQERHEEAVAKVEELFEAMSFDPAAGG